MPRHQTLRAKIDWSYNLKNEKERLLFKHLSVFAGGCTLGAVETVCSGDGLELVEILELLSSLVSKSMINAQRQPGKETRYHFLETTRQYASDKLVDAGESEKLRTRHRDFYLALVETNQPVWVTREQILWIQRLQPELENLRRALEWSFSDAGDGRILSG